MKPIDNRNITARTKALAQDDPQPYSKLFVDSRRACPHCDTDLRRPNYLVYWEYECDCSIWSTDPIGSGKYKRTPKDKINEATS